jgi:hypothetical protein
MMRVMITGEFRDGQLFWKCISIVKFRKKNYWKTWRLSCWTQPPPRRRLPLLSPFANFDYFVVQKTSLRSLRDHLFPAALCVFVVASSPFPLSRFPAFPLSAFVSLPLCAKKIVSPAFSTLSPLTNENKQLSAIQLLTKGI